MTGLFAAADTNGLLQFIVIGLTTGSLYALIALGYTMVYGIVELINFAHGDLFMLGSFLALTLMIQLGLNEAAVASAGTGMMLLALALLFLAVPIFCAGLNWSVDRLVYKPLRSAPKLAPLVSAIGVSFVFMNIGLLWRGPVDINFPKGLISDRDIGASIGIHYTVRDAMVIMTTIPIMIALTIFVRYTKLGKAMRATAQNPTAASLMGINVDRVIGSTFLIGGALAGAASVIYCFFVGTVNYQMGFQNGLYAFTAAVVGGIGKIPGAVIGGLLIGLVQAVSRSGLVEERWTEAIIFAILILILIFRPTGILGSRVREKV